MKYNYTAIVLDKRDIAEVDRLYTFYTREEGKMTVVGKGTRKVSAKLAPHLENFTFVNLSVARRHGRGNIAGAIAEDYFVHIKQHADVLPRVYDTMRIFNRLVHDNEQDQKLFALCLHYLATLDAYVKRDAIDVAARADFFSSAFLFHLFRALGYDFTLGQCMRCDEKLEKQVNYFDAAHAGVLCPNCGRNDAHVLPLTPESLSALRLIMTNTLTNLIKVSVSDKECAQLRRITGHFAQWIMR